MKKAKFITIEGGEGCGKSTQIAFIKKWFEEHDLPYVLTLEPGGSPLGMELRKILKNSTYEFSDLAELYLFNAGRVEHIDKVIRPNLEKGVYVICDRYFDSSIAYQGNARGLGYERVKNICFDAVGYMIPDLTIWLDLDPENAFARKGGADEGDRIEQTGLDFHKKVYEGYKRLYAEYPERIKRVDASQSVENVSKQIDKILENLVKDNNRVKSM